MDQFLHDRILPKYLHSTLTVLLFTFAIFPKEYKFLGTIYYCLATTTMSGGILGSLIPLYMADQSLVKVEIFSTLVPQISDLLIFLYFSHREEELLDRIESLKSKNFDNVLNRTDTFFKANFLTYFILHTAWASLFVLSTIVYILMGLEFSYRYSITIPFWLSCDVRAGNRLCWKIDSSWELWLANTLTATSVGLFYLVYCAALILYSVFMANIWIHFETMKDAIRELAERMKSQRRTSLVKFERVKEYDEGVIDELCDNFKYQQLIRGYCNEIIEFMRGYEAIFLAEFWGALVFLGFTSIMEGKNDGLLLLKTMIVSVSGAIGFVIHCIYAQVMADSNEMILHELAEIPWYEQSIKFRKIYLMCLTHNQKPIEVTAGGMFTYNYGFSMNCLKTMYSFLNMMLLHYRRHGSM